MNKVLPDFFYRNSGLLIVLLLSILIVWPLFAKGYFFHHDDLQVMRIFQMRKCIEDFQIPCRWVPDMGYGNGYPLFNFYGVLPYYIGAILSGLLGFVGAAKALFFIPLVLGGVGMFYLVRELYGEKAGLLAAILYQFAPYRALDIYVRGAIAESFALSIVPFVFYFHLKLIKSSNYKNLLYAAVSLGLFLLSHNIMTMFFVPLILIWDLYWLFQEKFKTAKQFFLSFFLGVGVASFFIFPAFLEKNLVKSETLLQGGTDFRAHFVSISQLFFDRTWGWGGSVFGPNDTISFQVGWPHLWLVAISSLFLIWNIWLRRKDKSLKDKLHIPLFLILLFSFLLSLFLMHNKSSQIWEAIQPLQYAQFPWRFLSITIFTASIIGGLLVTVIPKRFQSVFVVSVITVTILLNWQFFKPKEYYPWVDDHVKLSDPLWEIQQKAGLEDYLPKTDWLAPQSRAPGYPEIRKGQVDVEGFKVYTNHFDSKLKVAQDATVEFPILEFPTWKVWVNGAEFKHFYDNKWGRISLNLPPGEYAIQAKLTDTPIRSVGNLFTLSSLLTLIALRLSKRFRKVIL